MRHACLTYLSHSRWVPVINETNVSDNFVSFHGAETVVRVRAALEECDDLDVETVGDFGEGVEGGVGLPAFDVADVGIIHIDHRGEFSQGETLHPSELVDSCAYQAPVVQATWIHLQSVCDSIAKTLAYEPTFALH